jgi:hypothetical protein
MRLLGGDYDASIPLLTEQSADYLKKVVAIGTVELAG